MKVIATLRAILLIAVGAVSLPLTARSATMLTAKNSMTLYVFEDTGGVPTCYDGCAKQWPPYLANGREKLGEGWAIVKRKDGSMQWTYHNRPLYFYADDNKAGDANGNGVGRVWHAAKE